MVRMVSSQATIHQHLGAEPGEHQQRAHRRQTVHGPQPSPFGVLGDRRGLGQLGEGGRHRMAVPPARDGGTGMTPVTGALGWDGTE